MSALTNQISYRRQQAAASGGIFDTFGSVIVSAGHGPGSRVNVTVPAGSTETDLKKALDHALELGQERKGAMGCWAEECPAPRWVTAAAVERGMQWGWTARWMARPTSKPLPEEKKVEGIDIKRITAVPEKRAEQIPFVDERWSLLLPLDPSTLVLGAFDSDTMVGTVAVHCTPSRDGAVFNLGVADSYQRRGIGRALMVALLRLAKAEGLKDVTLNATDAGAGLYLGLGFEDRGRGQTWWINSDMWDRPAPTAQQRAVSRAIALDSSEVPPTDNAMLPCNMTPMRLAATTDSPHAAAALEKQGIKLDALSAWDLGWKDRAEQILKDGALDQLDETEKATTLHTAIQRELAALCLKLGARTDVKDGNWDSPAVGWCNACGRPEIAQMIRDRDSGQA